jgi:hypothetical protein
MRFSSVQPRFIRSRTARGAIKVLPSNRLLSPVPRREGASRTEHRESGSRRGVVLLCTLVCLSVATVLVVMTTHQSLQTRRQGRIERQLRQTEFLLDAGVRRARAALAADYQYAGEIWQPTAALRQTETVWVEIHVSELQNDSLGTNESPGSRVTVTARLALAAAAPQTQRSHSFNHSNPSPIESLSPE